MGDILSTVGVFSTVGDIIMHVGDIMSTIGVFSTLREQLFVIWVPHSTEYPMVLIHDDGCMGVDQRVWVLLYQKMSFLLL